MADTLQQLWQQQFDALNRSKAVYDKTIQALEILAAPTAAQLTVLKNAQRGLLDTEYQMRLFLRTDTRLLDDAARIGQRLANDNSLTAFQRDQLQRQQAPLISEAGDFATLRSEVGWRKPGIQTIPIGNKIYDNLGTPPMWDWNSSGGRFGEALENFLGNLQSAGQWVTDVLRPFAGGATNQETGIACAGLINWLAGEKFGKIFKAPTVPGGASENAQYFANGLFGDFQGKARQSIFHSIPGRTYVRPSCPRRASSDSSENRVLVGCRRWISICCRIRS